MTMRINNSIMPVHHAMSIPCFSMMTTIVLFFSCIVTSYLPKTTMAFTKRIIEEGTRTKATISTLGLTNWKCRQSRNLPLQASASDRLDTTATTRELDDGESLVYDTPLKPRSLSYLYDAAAKAAIPCDAETAEGAHDAFRYEWGRWIDDESMEQLMERVNEIRLESGVYEMLVDDVPTGSDDNEQDTGGRDQPLLTQRLRVAGDEYWDVILHVLPKGSEWNGRWPTGAWAVVRCLTGMAEISMLRGPNRDGFYTKATKKDLRGGGDGTLAGGSGAIGEDCVKYVGGALRCYAGKSGKTTLLEVVVRPPIGKGQLDGDGRNSLEMESLEDPDAALSVLVPGQEGEDEEDDYDDKYEGDSNESPSHLGAKLGMTFDKVGGLDDQLNAIVRRVLASRANPEAARRLGVSHVRGILLSGPPGCGKTLLARELSRMLGAREPQIVNGPEILDKFVGEAERNIRALFIPAEQEYAQAGDASALHVIILDEMDAIARKRGTITGDSTGVRDSVVNQLLAKMDGVKEASNVLVVGLTNRPELLDPALLRPGRLEVQLRVELPDLLGRRDILRIHTRRMQEAGGLSDEAKAFIENVDEGGLPALTDHFTGAELAGLVRSAASFALARTVEDDGIDEKELGVVSAADLKQALKEVRPALGRQDEVLEMRYPNGVSACSPSMRRIMRDLERFTTTPEVAPADLAQTQPPQLQSLLLVGASVNGGSGVTSLACWAAAEASLRGEADYVRLVTSLDLLSGGGGGDEERRAAALAEKFAEATEMPNSLLVLDDVDQLCAGSGPGGYSSIMLATLRALLRSPPPSTTTAKAGGHSDGKKSSDGARRRKTFRILAATSRSDAACVTLHELFDETLVVPLLSDSQSVRKLLSDAATRSGLSVQNVDEMAVMIVDSLGSVGCKTALRLTERAVAMAGIGNENESVAAAQRTALRNILDDMAGDDAAASRLCEVY